MQLPSSWKLWEIPKACQAEKLRELSKDVAPFPSNLLQSLPFLCSFFFLCLQGAVCSLLCTFVDQISPRCLFSSSVAAEEAVDLRGRCVLWFMPLYKVHFTAGLTEMETEVHPRLGMQRRVGDGSGDYPCVLEPPVEWVGTPLLTQSLLPCSSCLQQERGLVPGEPRTSLCWELFWVQQLILHHWYVSRSHGRAYACDWAPLSSCWSKARLILTTPPPPPWAAFWWQGCQHSFPVWGSWALLRVPLALTCSVRYFKQGSFPRFSCASVCLCPFLACSLRAAALQPSIYMALICLSLFGTYMAPIGLGPECLPIFNIFIFTHADTRIPVRPGSTIAPIVQMENIKW